MNELIALEKCLRLTGTEEIDFVTAPEYKGHTEERKQGRTSYRVQQFGTHGCTKDRFFYVNQN